MDIIYELKLVYIIYKLELVDMHTTNIIKLIILI